MSSSHFQKSSVKWLIPFFFLFFSNLRTMAIVCWCSPGTMQPDRWGWGGEFSCEQGPPNLLSASYLAESTHGWQTSEPNSDFHACFVPAVLFVSNSLFISDGLTARGVVSSALWFVSEEDWLSLLSLWGWVTGFYIIRLYIRNKNQRWKLQ